MSNSETLAYNNLTGVEILTLTEVAAYLRVSEEKLSELVSRGGLPAQQIGGEWRFLKRAVDEWLRHGPDFHECRMIPSPWVLAHPFWEELMQTVEKRILGKLSTAERSPVKRGTKQAVLMHFGVFKDDADLEEQLDAIRTIRDAAGK